MADRKYTVAIDAQDRFSGAFEKLRGQIMGVETAAGRLRNVMGGLGVGIAAGALVSLAKDAFDAVNKLNDLADKTSLTVEQLSIMSDVARQSGTSMEFIGSAVVKFQRSLDDARGGAKEAALAFKMMGIDANDGAIKTANGLDLVATRLLQMEDGVLKNNIAMQLFGKSGAELNEFLRDYATRGSDASRISNQMGEDVEKLTRGWRSLKASISDTVDALAGWIAKQGGKLFNAVANNDLQMVLSEQRKARDEIAKLESGQGGGYGGIYREEQLAKARDRLAELNKLQIELNKQLGLISYSSEHADQNTRKMFQGVVLEGDKAAKSAAKVKDEVLKLGAWMAQLEAPKVKFKELVDVQGEWSDAMAKGTMELERQTKELGLTRQEVLQLELAELDYIQTVGRVGVSQEELAAQLDRRRDAINGLITKLDELDAASASSKAAKETEAAWQRTAQTIEQSLTDALLRGFESGADFAKNFRDSLVNMFKTLVLRPVIQAIVSPVAGGMAGLFGSGAAGASGLGGMGGFNISSLFSGITSGATQAGGMAAFNIANLFGMDTVAAASMVGPLSIGLPILGIGALLYSLFGGKRGGPKTGGYGQSGLPDIERFFTPNQQDSSMLQIAQATQRSFDELVRSMGGRGAAGFAFGYDTDPEGTASDRIRAGVSVNGQLLYDTGNIETGRDSAATQAALELEAKRALLAALQASDMPQDIADILDSVTAATADAAAIDDILAVATALGSIYDLFNSDVLEDGMTAYEDSMLGVNLALGKQIDAVNRLVSEYDGSATAATALASATQGVYAAAVQAVGQINALRTQLSDLFQNSATNYRLAGMDNAGQRDYLQDEIIRLTTLIEGSTDASAIQRYATQLDQMQQRLWGLLTPAEQQASAESFAQSAEAAGTLADTRLRLALEGIQTAVEEMLLGVKTVMTNAALMTDNAATTIDRASVTLKTAGDTQLVAAGTQLAAAQTPIRIVVDGGGSEVGA